MTALLCLGLLLALAWGLHRWTNGFEVWTFEGRRQALLRTGELAAPALPLRGADGSEPLLWGGAEAPAAYLVDFIYTRCPGVCSALGSEYRQMQRELERREALQPALRHVHLVSISFDLEHDGPPQLVRYAAEHQADPRRWTLAVPATAAGTQALLGALGVIVVPDGEGGFVHNGDIHLLDARGRLRGLYGFDDWAQALAAAQRLVTEPAAPAGVLQ